MKKQHKFMIVILGCLLFLIAAVGVVVTLTCKRSSGSGDTTMSIEANEVPGVYVACLEHGASIIVIKADGLYQQIFVSASGAEFTGDWEPWRLDSSVPDRSVLQVEFSRMIRFEDDARKGRTRGRVSMPVVKSNGVVCIPVYNLTSYVKIAPSGYIHNIERTTTKWP